MAKIEHQTGYKDDYKVVVTCHDTEWGPTNEELFTLVKLWFESEDHEFGENGYGCKMPWFYLSLIMVGEPEKAFKAYQKRGWNAKTYFEKQVKEHGDEIKQVINDLQDEAQQ